jgi:hypothetical protein
MYTGQKGQTSRKLKRNKKMYLCQERQNTHFIWKQKLEETTQRTNQEKLLNQVTQSMNNHDRLG